VNRNPLHAAAAGLAALSLPLAFMLASPAGASPARSHKVSSEPATAAAPRIGLKSCALPNTFLRVYYYSGYDEYCFGDAGGMNVNIPQVSDFYSGNNAGYFVFDGPFGGGPTTYYFQPGGSVPFDPEVHVSYIDIY
jgi:hypothetical protein